MNIYIYNKKNLKLDATIVKMLIQIETLNYCALAIIIIFIIVFMILLTFQVYMNGNDAEVRPYLRVCTSRYHNHFSWTIYVIEGVMLSFGAFLAFETRKVCILNIR